MSNEDPLRLRGTGRRDDVFVVVCEFGRVKDKTGGERMVWRMCGGFELRWCTGRQRLLLDVFRVLLSRPAVENGP